MNMAKLSNLFHKFLYGREALGWQIIVFVVGLVGFSIVWFVATWPTDLVYVQISELYMFSGITLSAVNFARGVIALLPAIGVFFLVIWLWVNVNRRDQY